MAFEELLVVVAFGPLVLTLSSPPPVALRKNDADCFSSEAGAPSEKKRVIKTLSTTPQKLFPFFSIHLFINKGWIVLFVDM